MLRVLQNKEIERLGSTETIKLDIRIIAATHRDLEQMLADSRFREDLFFRLNVFPIRIPPLRERKSDIPMLVDHFIHIKARDFGIHNRPKPNSSTIGRLIAHNWPGNVRELENAVERALIESQGVEKGGQLTFSIIGNQDQRMADPFSPRNTGPEECSTLGQATAAHIRYALELSDGKINGPGGAAKRLDIHPNTLRSKMDRLGISYKKRNRSA